MHSDIADLRRIIRANTPLEVEELKAAWPALTIEQKVKALVEPTDEDLRLRYLLSRILLFAQRDSNEWIASVARAQILRFRIDDEVVDESMLSSGSILHSLRRELTTHTADHWIYDPQAFCRLPSIDRLRVVDLIVGYSPLALNNIFAQLLQDSTKTRASVDIEIRDILVQAIPRLAEKHIEHSKYFILGWTQEMSVLWRSVPQLPEHSRTIACRSLPIAAGPRDDESIPADVIPSLGGFDLYHLLARDDVRLCKARRQIWNQRSSATEFVDWRIIDAATLHDFSPHSSEVSDLLEDARNELCKIPPDGRKRFMLSEIPMCQLVEHLVRYGRDVGAKHKTRLKEFIEMHRSEVEWRT